MFLHNLLTHLQKRVLVVNRTLPLRLFSTNISQVLHSKLMYEREIRSTLSKLERVIEHLPQEGAQRQKTVDDLERLNEQFRDLVFGDDQITTDDLMVKSEKDMKKLLTITKSKFYMLRVNFPKAFEVTVDRDIINNEEYDPLADKKPSAAENLGQAPGQNLKQASVSVDLDEDETVEAKQKRQEQIEKDRVKFQAIDRHTDELIKSLEVLKKIDTLNAELAEEQDIRRKQIKYVEREDDLEMKKAYEEEQERFEKMHETMSDQIDGEIDLDMHGNVQIRMKGGQQMKEEGKEGIQGPGTYVLRNGKLVPGKAEVREHAQYSNWYCSNADPEDIRRHRELMDRMHYRGPKWEGVGVPKSILEEYDPTYRKVEADPHPMEAHPEKEGKKDFEYVVR